MNLQLKYPEKYKAFIRKYGILGDEKHQIKSATITPCLIASGFDIRINFIDGKYSYDYSPTVRGAKQSFAFVSEPKSKWIEF